MRLAFLYDCSLMRSIVFSTVDLFDCKLWFA